MSGLRSAYKPLCVYVPLLSAPRVRASVYMRACGRARTGNELLRHCATMEMTQKDTALRKSVSRRTWRQLNRGPRWQWPSGEEIVGFPLRYATENRHECPRELVSLLSVNLQSEVWQTRSFSTERLATAGVPGGAQRITAEWDARLGRHAVKEDAVDPRRVMEKRNATAPTLSCAGALTGSEQHQLLRAQ